MKLCKDCKHYRQGSGEALCERGIGQPSIPDYVHGGMRYHPLQAMKQERFAQPNRMDDAQCGPAARWFEPKEK